MADLYIMPSISEPFGITPLEAMRNDTPVIISKQSGSQALLNKLIGDQIPTTKQAAAAAKALAEAQRSAGEKRKQLSALSESKQAREADASA